MKKARTSPFCPKNEPSSLCRCYPYQRRSAVFYFSYLEIEKPGRGTYDLVSSLYLAKWDVPEYRKAMLIGTDREF